MTIGRIVLTLAGMTLAALLCLALGACSSTQTTQQQEQQVLNVLTPTLTAAETAFDVACAAGVVPAQDVLLGQAAEKAANAALAQAQAAVTAGDTNGYQVALQAMQAALQNILPIINAPSAQAKLRALRAPK